MQFCKTGVKTDFPEFTMEMVSDFSPRLYFIFPKLKEYKIIVTLPNIENFNKCHYLNC